MVTPPEMLDFCYPLVPSGEVELQHSINDLAGGCGGSIDLKLLVSMIPSVGDTGEDLRHGLNVSLAVRKPPNESGGNRRQSSPPMACCSA
jgi:hypothetical protein